MVLTERGMLEQSVVGGCVNYSPDRTQRPTGALAEDVPGNKIYPCFNSVQTEAGKKIGYSCGAEHCARYVAVRR